MDMNKGDTGVVFIDPQNDVLSEKGLSWPLIGDSVRENNTIENMERIFKTAKQKGFEVFISPHYFFQRTYVLGIALIVAVFVPRCDHHGVVIVLYASATSLTYYYILIYKIKLPKLPTPGSALRSAAWTGEMGILGNDGPNWKYLNGGSITTYE
jgi:hypothetical protein